VLAKEVASIDGISGGRLSLGLGIGGRADDFVGDGLATRGLGSRLDRQLEVFHDIWTGKPVGGGSNPAVPAGTREVPLLFGGFAPAAFERMARWGQGYVGGSLPAAAVSGMFQQARSAWAKAGRQGSPRLIAIAYFALGDTDTARSNIRDYYSVTPEFADAVASAVLVSRAAIVL
jgi:alkanesulfonate monooxygenase SsuD/methylene tetrahydromethanopterin reductase-like flavin-dependent oxidoreductase (luciferase family)